MKKLFFFLVACIFALNVSGQNLAEHFQHHVYYLADDSLKGRLAGSKGEAMAYNYIADVMQQYGLHPKGDKDFLQAFSFSYGKKAGEKNSLNINNVFYRMDAEYFPFGYAASDSVSAKAVFVGYGMVSEKPKFDDYKTAPFSKGNIAIINIGAPEGKKFEAANAKYNKLYDRAKLAEEKGAAAVIFISTDSKIPEPDAQMK